MVVIHANEQMQIICKNWAFEDSSFDMWVHAKATSEEQNVPREGNTILMQCVKHETCCFEGKTT